MVDAGPEGPGLILVQKKSHMVGKQLYAIAVASHQQKETIPKWKERR